MKREEFLNSCGLVDLNQIRTGIVQADGSRFFPDTTEALRFGEYILEQAFCDAVYNHICPGFHPPKPDYDEPF